jgi:3-deoxy-D-manno-octulosonic-acid transferase
MPGLSGTLPRKLRRIRFAGEAGEVDVAIFAGSAPLMLPLLYRALTRPLPPVILPYLEYRRRRGKEDDLRLRERRGDPGLARPSAPLLWIHAASLGEATAMLRLIDRILEARPQLEILVTTGTVTSARLLETRLPARARHQFAPIDLPGWVARFLDHWRPDLALWVESELWPNLVLATRARGVPMLLINGRLSVRSYRRWRRCPGLIRPVLGGFAQCLAQDEEQAGRLRQLGAREAIAVGDLKAAASPLPVDESELARLRQQVASRPLWLAASTHAGEEEIVADAHCRLVADHPDLLTVIVPRHPSRGDAIAAMLAGQRLKVARRGHDDPVTAETEIYLADTLGELGLFYRLSGVAFIGGSLAQRGGHNPFEAARFDCAILHGPDMSNCAGMARALAEAGATQIVTGADELAAAVSALLADGRLRGRRAAAATRAAAAGERVLDRVLDYLAPWLDRLAPCDRRPMQSALGEAPVEAPQSLPVSAG